MALKLYDNEDLQVQARSPYILFGARIQTSALMYVIQRDLVLYNC